MKRLRRIAWNWRAVVALICIATAMTWNYFTCFPFSTYWHQKNQYWILVINVDGIAIARIDPPLPLTFVMTTESTHGTSTTTSVVYEKNRHALAVPFWTFFLLAIPPVWLALLRELRRTLRRRRGGCDVCCYDLTGNTSGVCPECGTSIVAGAKA